MTHTHCIGIMADSHGQWNAIAEALAFFKMKSCDGMVHLGDICDSAHPETADTCVALLRSARVRSIKGNNDHTLVVNHAGYDTSIVPPGTIEYLKKLPLVLRYREAVFAHSLPFEAEKGLSCMIGTLGTHEIASFFNQYPQHLLFRGHQHAPEIVWRHRGRVAVQEILPNRPVTLRDRLSCIVTCGALDNGFCLIWEPDNQSIFCYKI